jgi:hypothetical protein
MTKYILLFCAILLISGCATPVPVTQKFPDAPNTLMAKCPELDQIKGDTVVLSEFLKTVTNNYTKYHECSAMLKAWQDWYLEQKKISENLNKSQ